MINFKTIFMVMGLAIAFECASYASDGNESYIGEKSPSEAKSIGDIVFSDGSATAYNPELILTNEQKAEAIAVIFYEGDGALGDKPLGVGLVHNKSTLVWCTASANAYNTNISSIQCQPTGSGYGRNYTFVGDTDGSDNLEQIARALGSGNDTGDGAKYPAFYFAREYASQRGSHIKGSHFAGGWYLPTIAELFQIWKVKETVDAASSLCGGDRFGSDWYWSSSEHSNKNCVYKLGFDYDWGIGFKGDKFYDLKSEVYLMACAIRVFDGRR